MIKIKLKKRNKQTNNWEYCEEDLKRLEDFILEKNLATVEDIGKAFFSKQFKDIYIVQNILYFSVKDFNKQHQKINKQNRTDYKLKIEK